MTFETNVDEFKLFYVLNYNKLIISHVSILINLILLFYSISLLCDLTEISIKLLNILEKLDL